MAAYRESSILARISYWSVSCRSQSGPLTNRFSEPTGRLYADAMRSAAGRIIWTRLVGCPPPPRGETFITLTGADAPSGGGVGARFHGLIVATSKEGRSPV